MSRMAGDVFKVPDFKASASGSDRDMVEMDDGTKVHKDQVAEYVEANYEKTSEEGNKYYG